MDDESNNELVEELGHTENPIEDHDDYGVSDDNWVPDPMDAGPGCTHFQIIYYSCEFKLLH